VYDDRTRGRALDLLRQGTLSQVSRETGISRAALREWRDGICGSTPAGCPRCSASSLAPEAYAALLGYYLGDGCLSRAHRYFTLRVSCDEVYPAIADDVAEVIEEVRPGARVFRVAAPGTIVIQAHWKHWPCLFPQHGPGRKHERPIVLEAWQRTIVEAHPGPFLRGLFHSDGSRVRNWATREVAGELKRYDYPRWQFTNVSLDIRELCCWALDLADVPWRQSNRHHISVSTRAGVARLDELIGLKA